MLPSVSNTPHTDEKRLARRPRKAALLVAAACLIVLPLTASWLYADTITINATIYNTSSYSVKVTVRGFQQGTATRTMRPGTNWRVSMKSNDNGLAITAVGPKNTINSRVGNGGFKVIANDRRPQFIRWDRQ